MAPHLIRAQRAYKGYTHFISHTHTHAHTTLQILVMCWYDEKKMTDQYAEEKRAVFSFVLRE